MPQQRHVIDRVGARDHRRDHARDQGRDLQVRVDTTGLDQMDVVLDEVVQTGPSGQLQHRRQARARHEVRVIEDRLGLMTESHLPGALPLRRTDPSTRSILPQQKGIPA